MADYPYFKIVEDGDSGKYNVIVQSSKWCDNLPKINSFELEDMVPVGSPKKISRLKWDGLGDKLREYFEEIRENEYVANAFMSKEFRDCDVIQFYEIPIV